MTNSKLPETRYERIALARATIVQTIYYEDATVTGDHASDAGAYPGCWCFTLQAGSFDLGVQVSKAIAVALVAAGFGSKTTPAVTYGFPVGAPDQAHVALYFHVPVGAS
jgi:hypothetical protein